MRFLAICLLLVGVDCAFAQSFRLPSYVSLQGGVGNEQYRDSSLSLGLSLKHNWQIEAGADRTTVSASDDSGGIVTKGYRIGVGSDPLRDFSARVSGESWQMEDEVKAKGVRGAITYAPELWTFTAEFFGQQIDFSSLPYLASTTGEQTVQDNGFSLRVSTLVAKNWNFTAGFTAHRYDKDLSQLTDLPTITINRMPASVLTTLTGFSRNDAYLGATYFFRKWDVGAEGGRSISAIDGVKTKRFGLSGTYYLNSSWSFGVNTMTFRPESTEESSTPSNSTSGIVTFKW